MSKIIVGLILAAVVWGQLVRVPLLGNDVPVIDLVMAGSLLWLVSTTSRSGWRTVSQYPAVKWFGGLVMVLGLSLLVNLSVLDLAGGLTAVAYWLRFVVYGLTAYLLATKLSSHDYTFYIQATAWAFLAFITISFLQFGLFPDFELFEYLGWDPHFYRLVGTFFDPNFSAIFVSFGLLLMVLLMVRSRGSIGTWLLGSGMHIAALVATLSRTGLVSLLVGIATVAMVLKRRWIWWGLLLVMGGALVVPTLRTRIADAVLLGGESVSFRLASWQEGLTLTLQHPILGVGYNTLATVRETTVFDEAVLGSHAISGFDNSFLTISATSGLVGLILFVGWIWLLLRWAWANRAIPQPLFQEWFIVSTAALAAGSLLMNAWLYPPLFAIWLLMMSLSLSQTNKSTSL